MLPSVLFDNGVTATIGPVEYDYKGPGGDGEILRLQIPLKLAWYAHRVGISRSCWCDIFSLYAPGRRQFTRVKAAR
jgi:hypothetical protein